MPDNQIHMLLDNGVIKVYNNNGGLLGTLASVAGGSTGVLPDGSVSFTGLQEFDAGLTLEQSIGLHATKATLTNAQIKALTNTAVQVVAAPGANKTLLPILAYVYSQIEGGYEGFDADGDLVLQYSNGNAALGGLQNRFEADVVNHSELYDFFNDHRLAVLYPGRTRGAALASAQFPLSFVSPISPEGDPDTNTALSLKILQSTADDLTFGHADNVVGVMLFYSILDLT